MPAEIHVVGQNHETLCGEVRPTDALRYAYTVEGAKALTNHHAVVCQFCTAAYLKTDVQQLARGEK